MKQTSNFARGGETADLSARIRTNTPPPPVISRNNSASFHFQSALAFKLRALLVICLLMPFASSLASADDHIDNMCFLPASEGGWAGFCYRDTHWTAGWYVYRHGETWTQNNRAWLAGDILGSSETKREVAAPPRGTEPRITRILPTLKQTPGHITTLYPHGMTVTIIRDSDAGVDEAIITFRDSSSTITFDYTTKTKTETNGVTGEKYISQF